MNWVNILEFKGYKIIEEENRVIIENVRDFNPVHVFECGQCFRWQKQDDGSYTGVARGRVANVAYRDGSLIVNNTNVHDFMNIWFEYFDLGSDYSGMKALLDKDEHMNRAIRFGYGIRLLKQDLWETLISFIISANNRIPMIMKTVAAISRAYGRELYYEGKTYYSFPDAQRLAGATLEELEACRGGFRCKYIMQTSSKINKNEVLINNLYNMDTDAARAELMKLPGVGPKVADCVLLYSGTKRDVFPTDVWVKRVMEELYFKREASFKEIQDFAESYFGKLKGIAQQYLFYYARENRIGAR